MKSRIKLHFRNLAAAAALSAALIVPAALAGCGGSEAAGNGDQSAAPAASSTSPTAAAVTPVVVTTGVSRPQPGTVQALDSIGDVNNPDGQAPKAVDISSVSISRQGNNLVFTMSVTGKLPDKKPPDAGAGEWGLLIDTNRDGKPDWGIYADLPPNDVNWTWGLYDQNAKTRLTGQQFPGSFAINGTDLPFTVDSSALQGQNGFNWMAYTDEQEAPTQLTPKPAHSTDKVPDTGYPTGPDWIDYP